MRNGIDKKARTAFTASLFSGEIPQPWSLVPIGDVLTATEYGLSEPGDAAGNTRIVGMRDLQGGVVNLQNLATVDSGGADWSAIRLRKGDILLNRTNSPDLVGKVAIVQEDLDAVFASYLVRLHVDKSKASPEYVNYWLNSPVAQRALKRLATRAISQANINPTEFKRHCPIPLPPPHEQDKISGVLLAWDETIAVLTSLRKAKLRRLAWLRANILTGNRRLAGFSAAWKLVKLSDVLTEHGLQSAGSEEVFSVSVHKGLVV